MSKQPDEILVTFTAVTSDNESIFEMDTISTIKNLYDELRKKGFSNYDIEILGYRLESFALDMEGLG